MESRGVVMIVALLAAGPALAQEKSSYIELAAGKLEIRTPDVRLSPNFAAVVVGHRFFPNLAVEAIAAASERADVVSGATFRLDSAYGLRLRPSLRLGERVEGYATLGYLHTSLSASGLGSTINDARDIGSAGAGIVLKLSASIAAVVDYAVYWRSGADSVYSVTGGLRFSF